MQYIVLNFLKNIFYNNFVSFEIGLILFLHRTIGRKEQRATPKIMAIYILSKYIATKAPARSISVKSSKFSYICDYKGTHFQKNGN